MRLAALLLLAGTALPGCVAAANPVLAGSAMVGERVVDAGQEDDATRSAVAAGTAPRAPASRLAAASDPTITPPPVIPLAPILGEAPTEPSGTPEPARPLPGGQNDFARFVRYAEASARQAGGGVEIPSAVLSDPVALDGKRRRCEPGQQLVAVIDLDPAGGVFDPPASPAQQPGVALGLAVLRAAGVEIAWMSDLPNGQSGRLRAALGEAGLDPRGQDIMALRFGETNTKDQRRGSLAAVACIIAIAGDERADFDMRFKYLRNPEAGAGLEPLIGDGWFLIEPLLGN